MTASRALRQPELVSAKMRARVSAAVETLGYAPNEAARALVSATSSTIGVLIPSISNLVFVDVLRGIYDAAEDTPYQVQIANTRYRDSKEQELLKVFAAQRPAGLIVTGVDQSPATRAILSGLGSPVVQIMDVGADPVDMMIGFDHRQAAHAATRHLVEQGYRRIGFIGARMDPRSQKRLDGYIDALTEAGLFDDGLILTSPQPTSVAQGSRMFGEFLAMAPDADAVFCNNDDMALGALFECQRRHIRVPGQFGIMGYNNIEYAAASAPSLSSVKTPCYEMGQGAVQMIAAAARGQRPDPAVVDLGCQLMPRESTDRRVGQFRAER
nr:LacI family DNA-binding transcriptional regulator [Frigidibacter mobilis]